MNIATWFSRITLFAAVSGLGIFTAVGFAAEQVVECSTNCIEVLQEGEYVHTFYVDAKGARYPMSTSLRAEESVDLAGPKAHRASENLWRIPIDFSQGPAKLGCGVDGYGWNHGETMYRETISDTWGTTGRTATDARSIYMARGRGVLTITTTTFPPSGAPTSTTQTSGIETPVRGGAAGCIREN
jgi:hypothetical protein